jgi:hypothetical protein
MNQTSNPKLGRVASGWIYDEGYGNGFPTPITVIQPTIENQAYSYQNLEPSMFPLVGTQNAPVIVANNIPVITTTPNTPQQQNAPNCNCLHGTPVINTDGSCGCVSNTEPVKIPVVDIKNGQPVIYYVNAPQQPTGQGTSFDAVQFIKDNPLIIGAAVLGLFLVLGKK